MNVFSILLYLFLGCFPLLIIWIFRNAKKKSTKFTTYFLAFLPAALFASLRGDAGTDTEHYREIYANSTIDSFINIFKIGPDFIFWIFFEAFFYFGFHFNLFLFFHATICLLVFSYGCAMLDKYSPVLALSILPVLFIDATFNGLRYGLAFAITVLVVSFYYSSGKSSISKFFLILPGAVHSSLLSLLLLSPLIYLFILILLAIIGLNFNESIEFFTFKALAYKEIDRPGALSGIVPIISYAALLYILAIGCKWKLDQLPYKGILYISVFLFATGIFISLFSVAGLRILQISVFFLAIAANLNSSSLKNETQSLFSLILGIFLLANFYRQIFIVGPVGGVKFHPYDFFFQI